MAELNHFAISAGLGSTLGPSVPVQHGQIGSLGIAATVSALMKRRQGYIDDLTLEDDLSKQYEKALRNAYMLTRRGFSSDRVLADPEINADFVKACRDMGVDESAFRINLALIGLRKHNQLKAKSRKSVVPDQWRFAVASEIAARAMYYRWHVSVDTTLAHPDLSAKFDQIASSITPGHSSFEYRWAALNMRKKGANAKVTPKELRDLHWKVGVPFSAADRLPPKEGVYSLFERDICLFVAGTENLRESVQDQQSITRAELFEPELWRPNPVRLSWRYVPMPDSNSDYRFGVVRSMVKQWQPVFNIPRGKPSKRAA